MLTVCFSLIVFVFGGCRHCRDTGGQPGQGGEGNGLLEWSLLPLSSSSLYVYIRWVSQKKLLTEFWGLSCTACYKQLWPAWKWNLWNLFLITYYNAGSSQCCLSPLCSESELGHFTSKHCQMHNRPEIYIRREIEQQNRIIVDILHNERK